MQLQSFHATYFNYLYLYLFIDRERHSQKSNDIPKKIMVGQMFKWNVVAVLRHVVFYSSLNSLRPLWQEDWSNVRNESALWPRPLVTTCKNSQWHLVYGYWTRQSISVMGNKIQRLDRMFLFYYGSQTIFKDSRSNTTSLQSLKAE